MMQNKCLYCYEPLSDSGDFHPECCSNFFGTLVPPDVPYTIEQMANLAKEVVERSISVPGVQPKLSMSMVHETQQRSDSRLTVVGALGGQYILKPPSGVYPEMPENEHLTMRIAAAYKIQVVPSSLIRLKSGELSYITQRIDRTVGGAKIHMLDMFQIIEATDKYKSSMEKVGKALRAYSNNTLLDLISFFELAVFCFLTGNNDMHLKNFSMIKGSIGWGLAPAYDLLNVAIALPSDRDELALTVEAKKRKLKRENFVCLSKVLQMTDKQTQAVFNRMSKNKPKAIEWIDKSFLSEDMKKAYKAILTKKYEQLEIGT